ncbi:MAG: HEAT repeat domain-containing protein [Candidatus Omnitrophota bacterium]
MACHIKPLAISALSVALLIPASLRADNNKNISKNDRPAKILVCSALFMALGEIAEPGAKQVLIKGIKSNDFFIRAYAAEALGRLKDRSVVPALNDLKKDKNYLVKINALGALIELGESQQTGELLDLLNDKDPIIRIHAASKLRGIEDKYLPKILEIYLKEKNPLVEKNLIYEFAARRFKPALPCIRKALEDKDASLRQSACFALGEFSDPADKDILKKRLYDEDFGVRMEAKKSLGIIVAASQKKDSALSRILWKDVLSNDPALKSGAYLALARLKDIKVLPYLIKDVVSLDSPGFSRQEAASALVILKPYISELAARCLKAGTPLLSDNTAIVYKYKDEALSVLIARALRDTDNPLHKEAPHLLRIFNEDNAIFLLREGLYGDNPEVVAGCAHALGAFHDKGSVKYLIDICRKYGF